MTKSERVVAGRVAAGVIIGLLGWLSYSTVIHGQGLAAAEVGLVAGAEAQQTCCERLSDELVTIRRRLDWILERLPKGDN